MQISKLWSTVSWEWGCGVGVRSIELVRGCDVGKQQLSASSEILLSIIVNEYQSVGE